MSSILIKGMEMPTYEQGDLVLRVRWDGRVDKDYSGNTVATAVPVPPHGRLIDADALRAEFTKPNEENGGWRNPDEALVHKTGVWSAIDAAPTIIPAEEG